MVYTPENEQMTMDNQPFEDVSPIKIIEMVIFHCDGI